MESVCNADVMDLNPALQCCVCSALTQAEVARRVGEDAERNAAKQVAIESKRGADERKRVEKERIDKELKAATPSKLKDHRRPQQGERVEYQELRIDPNFRQQWSSEEEIQAILRQHRPASGTAYANYFTLPFRQNQMVPTALLPAQAPPDIAHAEL